MNTVLRPLTIVPAIDLRAGRCVRLAQGDPERETQYDTDPVARALRFVADGAQRLHVVDLDGAFGTGENIAALRAICAAVSIPVQTGGGMRSSDDIDRRLDAGASAVILGTLLVEDPSAAQRLIAAYGAKIIAGIDARGAHVAVRGWLDEGGRDRDACIRELASWGVERIIFTEIARDGMGTGYDLTALRSVAQLGDVQITASGGARTLADLEALARETPPNVDHAIVGRALYEGTLDLASAVRCFAR